MKKSLFCLLALSALLVGCGSVTSSLSNTSSSSSSEPEKVIPEVNVIVLAGQSNAEGNSDAKNLEKYCIDTGNSYEEYVHGYNTVKITYHNHYYFSTSYLYSNRDNPFEPNFVDVKAGQGKTSGWVGPELGMAQYINNSIKASQPVYIIKFASGGTGFSTTPSWYSPSSGTTGELYQKLTKYVDNGLEHLVNQGLNPKIRSFVWMQGEADSKTAAAANKYKDGLKNMITDFRSKYASYALDEDGDNIGVVDGYISDSGQWKEYKITNAAKEELASELKNYYTVDTTTTGLDLKLSSAEHGGGDNYHYTIDSMIKLGQTFGKTIIDNEMLIYEEGTVEEVKDFSVDDGVIRNNNITLEAENGIFAHGYKHVIENTEFASNGKVVGYFWESYTPRIKFVVDSDKEEKNALISVRMAPTFAQKLKELPHPIYKTRMLTVNGEEVRLSGTMQPRKTWYDFADYSGYVNLKKGINIIEFHHDLNQTYAIEEGRVNFDCIKISSKDAVVVNTNTNIIEAENCSLQRVVVSQEPINSPSNGSLISGLNVIAGTIEGSFNLDKAVSSAFFASFGLNSEFNLNEYIELEVNNQKVSLNSITLYEYNLDKVAGGDWREFALCNVDLVEGQNTFKLKVIKERLDVNLDYIRICSTGVISFN